MLCWTGSLHWELCHYQLRTENRDPTAELLSTPSARWLLCCLSLLQTWIICVGVSRTARSSPTCLTATCRTSRGLTKLSLLHQPQPLLPNLLQLGLHLHPPLPLQRGNPSRPSPPEWVSLAPSLTLWSRQLPQQGLWSRIKSRHRRSSRFFWWLMNHNRSGKKICKNNVFPFC